MKKTLTLIFLLSILQINAQCWQAIDAGEGHTAAIKKDGTLWTWGYNNFGQLGDATNKNKSIPTQVGTSSNWSNVSTGNNFTIALKTDGTLWAWGNNTSGELGDGTNVNKNSPIQIGNSRDWQSISTGSSFTAAIKTNGTLWFWGSNSRGQLGNGSSNNTIYSPTQTGIANDWQTISCGGSHIIGLKTNGSLWAWGNNEYGQVGDATGNNIRSTPNHIGTATNWKSISTGAEHSIALKSDGTLWGWGYNVGGQLGDGTTSYRIVPTLIGLDSNWESVSAGGNHTTAIKFNGTLWATGRNNYGQLGDGTIIERHTFTSIGLQNDWLKIAGGSEHNVGIRENGELFAWGSNFQGRLGNGKTVDEYNPVQILCPNLSTANYDISDLPVFFPNPVKSVLNLSNEADALVIFDTTGKKVFEQLGGNLVIDLEHLQPGIYLLQIFDNNNNNIIKYKKLIKE